jgi:hypothetical protein
MSMTKRHLESLPEEEQNAICGDIDPDYEAWKSQREANENQPWGVVERILAGDLNLFLHNLDACIAETETIYNRDDLPF